VIRIIAALLVWLAAAPTQASESKLTGVWKLTSFVVAVMNTGERRPIYGANPKGYLIITPERFTLVLTADGRKAPDSDEERLNNFRTMFAYTGSYRIESDRIITAVEVAWNESWVGTQQTRIFRLEGDRLFIESIPTPSVNNPALGLTRGIVEFERSK
jgi:hypothetical protein